MRVLLDTNIFVSFLLAPDRKALITEIVKAGAYLGKFTFILPTQMLSELESVIASKKHLSKRITSKEIKKLVGLLRQSGLELARIQEPTPHVTRDPKDDYLLAAALFGQADYLVTGDKDLLDLKQVGNLQILSPRDFAKKLRSLVLPTDDHRGGIHPLAFQPL